MLKSPFSFETCIIDIYIYMYISFFRSCKSLGGTKFSKAAAFGYLNAFPCRLFASVPDDVFWALEEGNGEEKAINMELYKV